jgi:hypothetical protein
VVVTVPAGTRNLRIACDACGVSEVHEAAARPSLVRAILAEHEAGGCRSLVALRPSVGLFAAVSGLGEN